MNTDTTLRISSPSVEATEAVAAALGAKLRGGEVIALSSDLGGGKTAFVRGLARGMASPDHVSSPTFTLARQYYAPGSGLTLHHFDFYRLDEPGIMSLELAEIRDDPKAVIAVEWAAIVEDVLPEDRIDIEIIRSSDDSRDIVFTYPPDMARVVESDMTGTVV